MKLLEYIQGKRNGKEANRLEKEAMKDPFLADAMDGYQQTTGEHIQRIKELESQIATRSERKRRNTYAITWSITACLLLGIGISGYFIFLKKEVMNDNFVVQKTTIPKDTIRTTERELSTPTPPPSPIHPNRGKEAERIDATSQKKTKEATGSAETPTIQVSKAKAKAIKKVSPSHDSASYTEKNHHMDIQQIPPQAVAQSSEHHIIRGKITDNKGEPLIGANITYIGKEEGGLISDINGEFLLPEQDRPDSISISYIGFEKVTLPVDSNKTMLIAMNECDDSTLEEVVITGTGSSKKMTVTGAISTVSIEELKRASTDSIPQPVIGMERYKKYLRKNMVHPTDKDGKKIKGEVVVTFTVNLQGKPENITISKGLSLWANREAIRLVKEGPEWTHGRHPVVLTISF